MAKKSRYVQTVRFHTDRKNMFEVKIPSARPVDISTLSEVEFNEELEKGYADMQAGRTKNAKKAFSDIRKDYGL